MTSKELIEKFGILDSDGFSTPIEWVDGVGFSIIKKYNDGYASLYKIGFGKTGLLTDLCNLWISASYGLDTSDGISLGTGKKGVWDPVDLDFNNEYFYDSSSSSFIHNGKKIIGRKIFLDVVKTHMRPTQKFDGIMLRFRLWFWRKFMPGLIKIVDKILLFFLWIISGERINSDIWHRLFSKHSERSNQKINEKVVSFEQSPPMDFFGYKAKRWSVVFYCSVHLIIYVIFYYSQGKIDLLSHILKNNFVALCYVVVTFAITEWLVPKIIKELIKLTPEVLSRISFKTLKVSVPN